MAEALRIDFVLEQTLGHVTHTRNLSHLVPARDDIRARFLLVPFDVVGPAAKIPGWGNWTVRAGIRAKRLLRQAWRTADGRPHAMFVHTQVPAVLLRREMRAVPTVVSIDATPIQYDELGEFYAHERGSARVEREKYRMNRRCFERARHLVTWSEWAKQGLIDGYGVAEHRITVVSPGVDTSIWHRPEGHRATEGPVRLLFVGGDLRRKGGDLLIDAVRQLRADPAVPEVELDLVTTADVDSEPGITVHRGLTPNSDELIGRYHSADIFCLPTLGDCLPMVLAEAAAAELPMVSTDVGAIHEIVRPGETGALIEPGSLDQLVEALRALVTDQDERRRLGRRARELADAEHDARTNADRLIEALSTIAAR